MLVMLMMKIILLLIMKMLVIVMMHSPGRYVHFLGVYPNCNSNNFVRIFPLRFCFQREQKDCELLEYQTNGLTFCPSFISLRLHQNWHPASPTWSFRNLENTSVRKKYMIIYLLRWYSLIKMANFKTIWEWEKK